MKINKTRTVISLLVIVTLLSFKKAEDIRGWFLSGSAIKKYEIGITTDSKRKSKVGYLKSIDEKTKGEFGTIMQSFVPKEYFGKRVKLTAYIKTKDVNDWAGMWMRVDGTGGKTLSFDNMNGREIRGNNNWKQYEIILDVPKEAINISYGVLLAGSGEVYIDNFKFTIVGLSTKTTNIKKYTKSSTKPSNTNFEN